MFVFKTVACEASACCELLLAIATQDFLAVCRLNFFGHDSVAWWLQWRVDSDRRMLEGNEQVKDAQISDSFLKDFVLRYKIDEAAAVALHSLPLGQQQEVTGQITAATNPSAVLLSRIKRLKQGLPPLNKAAVAAVAGSSLFGSAMPSRVSTASCHCPAFSRQEMSELKLTKLGQSLAVGIS